ncbi:MAG: Sua5/YciO/YrdC/YwlC family protein [Planctomycetota bacterium]
MNHRAVLDLTGHAPDALPTADALRAGGVVALPTDTVYALACRADLPRALDTLWSIKGEARRSALAWHLGSTEQLTSVIAPTTPMHRRVVAHADALPLTLALDPDTSIDAHRARQRVGIAPGVIDEDNRLLLRTPASELARAVITTAGGPVVMAAALPAGAEPPDTPTSAHTADLLAQIDPDGRVAVALHEDSHEPARAASTLIELGAGDAWRVLRPGAATDSQLERVMHRTILFVCTGNTCRSPMAEAIARHELSDEQRAYTRVLSAGAFAAPGAPATPEALEALREMGITLRDHASTPLTRELLERADVIYAMTEPHLLAALDIDPAARDRIALLDPDGDDVPDPIGHPMDVYRATAHTIHAMIRARLAEDPA